MKKVLTIIVLSLTALLLFAFMLLPKESFSEMENRSLSSTPKFSFDNLIEGKYMEDIEDYISDHFPLRSLFMNIKSFYSKAIGKQEINDVYYGNDNYLLEKYDEIGYINELSDVINELYKNNNKVNMSVMLVPTKISIYENKLPKNIKINNQQKLIREIYSKLDTNINKIELYDSFIKERDEQQLYYKTDHHWTSYGAYLAYSQFQNNYIDINKLTKKELTNSFKGSTYSKVVDYKTKNERIDIYEYKDYDIEVNYVLSKKQTNTLYNLDYLNKKDKYALFLDNNHPLITIKNKDIKAGNILIIKDSYANSFIPFLVNHYRKIHVIDPRYYKKSITTYIKENNIENILVLYNVGTLATEKNILTIR